MYKQAYNVLHLSKQLQSLSGFKGRRQNHLLMADRTGSFEAIFNIATHISFCSFILLSNFPLWTLFFLFQLKCKCINFMFVVDELLLMFMFSLTVFFLSYLCFYLLPRQDKYQLLPTKGKVKYFSV